MTTAITTTEALQPAVLLQLMWLASPALPVGGFSYSEGLEPAVDAAATMGDDERQCFTPMLAILSAQHETQYSRLFRS